MDFKELRKAIEILASITEEEWEQIENNLFRIEKNCLKEKRISEILELLGVPAHVKGYRYLVEAIALILEDTEKYLSGITKKLYPEVARKFNTTTECVERDIRNAIILAWKQGNPEVKDQIFNFPLTAKKKPTNIKFMATVADFIKKN